MTTVQTKTTRQHEQPDKKKDYNRKQSTSPAVIRVDVHLDDLKITSKSAAKELGKSRAGAPDLDLDLKPFGVADSSSGA